MRSLLHLTAALFMSFVLFSTPGFTAMHPKDLARSVDEKQGTAVRLIQTVSSFANDRFSNEQEKEDAQYAYSGFMARFESLREDREALERKEIMPDNETLEKYSKQYDRLIADLNAFLNHSDNY